MQLATLNDVVLQRRGQFGEVSAVCGDANEKILVFFGEFLGFTEHFVTSEVKLYQVASIFTEGAQHQSKIAQPSGR